jgi:hypothetical protein
MALIFPGQRQDKPTNRYFANASVSVQFPPPPRGLRGNREHRWRCAVIHVPLVYRARPLDGVADANSGWLGSCPKLEILRTVVVTHSIAMVNRFPIDQVSTEKPLCYEDVLEHIRAPTGPRMARSADHDVPCLVPATPSLPIAIFFTCFASAGSTSRRFHLLGTAAITKIPGST